MSEKKKVVCSIIIPTYNRCLSLERTMESITKIDFPKNRFELLIVDNNSRDKTPEVVKEFDKRIKNLSYLSEKRISLALARDRGAQVARGEILSYIDDDVVVDKNWLSAVIDIFNQNKKAGIVAGPILPRFETRPPEWIKKYYSMSGWLSLLDRGRKIHETHNAFGPNFSIRKKVLDLVGGFPADTIGVEAEDRPGVVEKIYIGNGDVGLCAKVKKADYRIIYAPRALVYHIIPSVRLSKKWWHSRLGGEGCCYALTEQYGNKKSRLRLFMQSLYSLGMTVRTAIRFLESAVLQTGKERYEFLISYYLSRAKTEFALVRKPNLAQRLWNIALTGVLPKDINRLIRLLP